LINQAQVRLIDESGGLQRVVWILPPHIAVGQSMELSLDKRQQPVDRRLVAIIPIDQQLGYVRVW
jgi:hypothetical protein